MEEIDEAAARDRHPPRAVSTIDDAYYRRLISWYADWQRPEREMHDASVRDECRAFLEREARLLDELRLEDWLTLFAPECVYWIPATLARGDPRREVAVAFDDRRRLEDRVYRLRTAYAWSQVPPSRTVRLIANVEVFKTEEAPTLMVRSNFMTAEFRAGETRLLAGWCGHRLARRDGRLEIEAKQVNLIDCDQNLRNPSIVI